MQICPGSPSSHSPTTTTTTDTPAATAITTTNTGNNLNNQHTTTAIQPAICMAVGPDQAMRSSGNNSDGNCNSNSGGLKKGPWTPAEDAILLEYVRKHGEGNWNAVQKNSGLSRCGKSCRLRWANHLRPNLKKGAFSPEEELLILRLHAQLGNKWARMAAHLPGRTDNEIKNYWNTRIKRRQRAGLPLYPTDIQRQAALNHNHYPSATTQPPLSPASPTTGLYSAQPLSLLDPFGFPSRQSYHLPLKRLREDNNNLSFHLGFSAAPPPPLYQPPPTHPFQYNPMGFTVNGSSAFAVKMELASSQMFGGEPAVASGGGELLDAMLQETAEERDDGLLPEGSGEQDMKWVQLVTGEGEDGGEPPPEPGDKCDDSEPPSGKKMKRDDEQPDNHHVNEDLSALLDMIPATVMPAAAAIRMSDQWCNSESGRMLHGPLSVITDEDMKLDMQQLAEGQHWNIGPCPWSPAGIC